MTAPSNLDRRLTSWLTEDAPLREPDGLLARTLEEVRLVRPQPAWLPVLRGTAMGRRTGAVPRVVVVLVLVGLLVLIAVGGALLGSGGPRSIAVAPPSLAPTPKTTVTPVAPTASIRSTLAPVSGLPGRFAFVSNRDGDHDIYAMDPDRTDLVQLTNDPGADVAPIWSPDGRRIAFSTTRNGDADIYVMNADGTGLKRITGSPGDELLGAWSPDGTQLAFTDATDALRIVAADGSGDRTIAIDTGATPANGLAVAGWMRTGDALLILFDASPDGGQIDIYRLALASGRVTALTSTPGDDGTPALSPDGSKIAFQSDRNGGCLFVMDTDGSNVQRLTTGCAKGFPKAWAPDGSRIGWAGARRPDTDQLLDIQVIDADGSNRLRLTDTGDVVDLSWGPSSP